VRLSPAVLRFVCEAAFIVLIAAATAVARLGRLWIALAVGAAWLLVSAVERAVLQQDSVLSNGRLGFLFSRAEPQPAPEPEPDAEEHPPTPAPEPVPPAPEPAPPAPDPQPPAPEPTPPPQLTPVPPPEPEPEARGDEEAEPTVTRLPLEAQPREWNVWELERIAREVDGRDPARDEELAYLLLELRQFANADGELPVSFDPVIRESFGELLYSAV
jgi:hypothetical protein